MISDEIYDGLTYADVAARSIAAIPGLAGRTLLVDGFSKRYAMTGFRLGFGIVPPSLAAHITTLVINNTSCAPHFVQRAGLAALEGPQTCVSEFCETFRTRRDSFIPALGAVDGVAVPLPAGAFYAFADVRRALRPHGLTAHAFADRLLNEFGVAVLPGTDFGDGGEGFLRYSFAAAPSALAEAVELTRQCVASLGATNHPVGVAS